MCMNCGCGMYDDDMGNKDNITTAGLVKAAMASNMDGKETMEELKKSLEKIKPEDLDKKIDQEKSK